MNIKSKNLVIELGQRLKQTRLNANLTQHQLADIIGKSRTAVERAEKGKCNLDTFVSILIALGVDEKMDLFLPEPPPSPVQLAKAKGKKRKRATGITKNTENKAGELGW